VLNEEYSFEGGIDAYSIEKSSIAVPNQSRESCKRVQAHESLRNSHIHSCQNSRDIKMNFIPNESLSNSTVFLACSHVLSHATTIPFSLSFIFVLSHSVFVCVRARVDGDSTIHGKVP